MKSDEKSLNSGAKAMRPSGSAKVPRKPTRSSNITLQWNVHLAKRLDLTAVDFL